MSTTINFDTENFGKLLLRLFVGGYFVILGVNFFVDGHRALILLGRITNILGITFSPIFFGSAFAMMHIVFGMTILIGFWFRLSCCLLGTITMFEAIIAAYTHARIFGIVLPTLVLSMVVYSMMFIGGGRFSAARS